jgi:RecB family exonuclease
MPDATPGDSLEFAARVLQRVIDSANSAVISWPCRDGDAELSPSPLLARLSLQSPVAVPDPGWHAIEWQNSQAVERLEADTGPPLLADERVSGGARTVQLQSVNPFAAFARGRLGIMDVPGIESGLPATLRGSVAHRVLHAFLADKPDSAATAGWTAAELEERSEQALSAVFRSAQRHFDPLHRRLMDFERERLKKILGKFVTVERLRPRYSIACVEERFEFERYGVRLSLRVDRIDRLDDKSCLIIDYKTGMPKSLLNRRGELSDLQLAVYAMAIDGVVSGTVGGLAIVNIDSRAITYKGTGGSTHWDPKRADEWETRLASWIRTVDDALKQLASGDVRINIDLLQQQLRPLALLSRVAELQCER